ncbi:hypothetical protein BC834DRAFT_393969 [Gloeopeniophorella convolvens]|nr:hypothetical protein BC834DRAFT_393969 [Gloeopeniophorella convolvens]
MATPIDLPLERSLYVGGFFRAMLYGIEVCTFSAAVYCTRNGAPAYRKTRRFYVAYGAVLLTLVTIAVTTDALWGQYMWIDRRNTPGGPLGFFAETESAWYNVFGSAADATANILGDGLLVYRCYMIWGSRWYVVILPILMYITSSVLVIITVVSSAAPHAFLLHGRPASFGVPWVSLSVALNILVTALIVARLLYMRALTRELLSPELARTYTSVAALLIESAAPFSLLGIGLVVTEAQGTDVSIAFSYVWGMFCVRPRLFLFSLRTPLTPRHAPAQSLSPQMIILRVAMGHGWIRETVEQVSTAGPVFAKPPARRAAGAGVAGEQSEFAARGGGSALTASGSEGPTVTFNASAYGDEKVGGSDSSLKKERSTVDVASFV